MAIDFAVAHPLLGDADLVRARKLLLRIALGRRTVLLVRIVAAVVVAVAHPPLLDALPVAARELVRATSLIWWGRRGKVVKWVEGREQIRLINWTSNNRLVILIRCLHRNVLVCLRIMCSVCQFARVFLWV